MLHTLNIEVNSEAERRFLQLMTNVNALCIDVKSGVAMEGTLCNQYAISGKTYEKIRNYLTENRAY